MNLGIKVKNYFVIIMIIQQLIHQVLINFILFVKNMREFHIKVIKEEMTLLMKIIIQIILKIFIFLILINAN